MTNVPHVWEKVTLGHSMAMCMHCGGTPAEIAVIGDLNHCPQAAEAVNKRSLESLAALKTALRGLN